MICGPKRILSIGEAIQTITDVRSRAKSYQSALIAITGIDGCGKGYVAALWRDWLKAKGFHVALIGIDGWLNLPNKRFDGNDPAEHFYLHALRFDEMFTQLVRPLQQDRSILVEAGFADETASQYRREVYEFQDVDVILLEGIYLLKRKFRHLYDASFWIDCTYDTALERAIVRRQEGLTVEVQGVRTKTVNPAERLDHRAKSRPIWKSTSIRVPLSDMRSCAGFLLH